jgi:hypothetical protein
VGSAGQQEWTRERAVSADRADPPSSERERARAREPASTIRPPRQREGESVCANAGPR